MLVVSVIIIRHNNSNDFFSCIKLVFVKAWAKDGQRAPLWQICMKHTEQLFAKIMLNMCSMLSEMCYAGKLSIFTGLH